MSQQQRASSTDGKALTKVDILKFPFPYKLWLAGNLTCSDFLRWNDKGTMVMLNLEKLQDYLDTPISIFYIKNCSKFLEHMHDFQFKRIQMAEKQDNNDDVLYYQHENFKRERKDLLSKIQRREVLVPDESQQVDAALGAAASDETKQDIQRQQVDAKTGKENQLQMHELAAKRMQGDYCFMHIGAMSEALELKEKVRIAQEQGADIELSTDIFENPFTSMLPKPSDGSVLSYAGTYGNVQNEHLKNFFGDSLPVYKDDEIYVAPIESGTSSTHSNQIDNISMSDENDAQTSMDQDDDMHLADDATKAETTTEQVEMDTNAAENTFELDPVQPQSPKATEQASTTYYDRMPKIIKQQISPLVAAEEHNIIVNSCVYFRSTLSDFYKRKQTSDK